MVRLADYVAHFLADRSVRQVFMVTGGGAMFLNNAFGQEERIQCIFNHHEQACAMAAEGYARVTGSIAVVNVTTGPGGINALNGVFGAWTDSIPMLVISGQVKRETCMATYCIPGLRQLGDQEADIIGMVKGITKYATLVVDPESIRYHLEKALYLATSGRPGPCWLDIPIDVQASQIDEVSLAGYHPAKDKPQYDLANLSKTCQDILFRICSAKRPVLLSGNGIRLAGAVDVFHRVISKLGIPVVTARCAVDLMSSDDPYFCGRPGIDGERAGNFAVQNSDLLLIVGSRLNTRQTGYDFKSFARTAFKVHVDADPLELNKPTLKSDLPLHCDAKLFLEELERQLNQRKKTSQHDDWLAWCKERIALYPIVQAVHREGKSINPYHFVEVLFDALKADDVIVCANGAAFIMPMQTAKIKRGQRLFFNSGCASMGYDLPAAIGACVASAGNRIICLAGDGSIQMNIQELQTIAHHRFPIKIFIFNNRGYLSIRQTQRNFFQNMVGSGPESGISFPDMLKISQAYDLPCMRIESKPFKNAVREALEIPGPILCDVIMDPTQGFEPRSASKVLEDGRIISPQLEDMYPFLERNELAKNILIPQIDD